jgi:hypothetical protein
MAARRHGSRTAFFDGSTTFNQATNPRGGVSVPAGATSQPVNIGRSADNFSFFVQVTGAPAFATQWFLQVGHMGSESSQGIYPDESTAPTVWYDAYYLGTSGAGNSTAIRIDIPSGGGAIMSYVPDFNSGWVRLHRTDANAACTVTAGWELQGD